MILDRVLRKATKRERSDVEQMFLMIRRQPRRIDFEPYTESFRTFNKSEYLSYFRTGKKDTYPFIPLVSYQALSGGFTICNIIIDNKLYSGCSHCIKSDRWLPIRGKMNAFRRALEQSEGVDIPQEKYFVSDGLVYSGDE